MRTVQCQKCSFLIKSDGLTLVGCLCDPDSPTWLAIKPDGRLMAGSHAEWITIQDTEQGDKQQ